jgi:hypothetical protein
MKKIVLLLAIAAMISGCTGGGGGTTEYETDEGTVKISGGGSGPDWCMEGAGYEMALAGTGGTESLTFEGFVADGKYAGLCHVFVQRTVLGGGEETVDYYFDEDMQDINIEHAINGEVVFSGNLNDYMAQMMAELGMEMEMPEN